MDEKCYSSKSYTKGAMALCVSDTMKMGIDLEIKKKRSPETIDHFIEKFATFRIENIPTNKSNEWFYNVWTAMESYFKLDGAGFSTPKNFALNLEQKSIRVNESQVAWLEHYNIDNFLICICCNKPFSKQDVRINYHGWED